MTIEYTDKWIECPENIKTLLDIGEVGGDGLAYRGATEIQFAFDRTNLIILQNKERIAKELGKSVNEITRAIPFIHQERYTWAEFRLQCTHRWLFMISQVDRSLLPGHSR